MDYVQLVRLRHLEILDVSCYGGEEIRSIDLRCESGLDQLVSLSDQEALLFVGTVQHMAIEDVDWMFRKWEKLQVFKVYE